MPKKKANTLNSLLDLATTRIVSNPNKIVGEETLIDNSIKFIEESLNSEDSLALPTDKGLLIRSLLAEKDEELIELGKVFILLGRVLNNHVIIPNWDMANIVNGKLVLDELIRTILKTLGSDISVGIITKSITYSHCTREEGFRTHPDIPIQKEVAIKLQKHEVGGKGSERNSNLSALKELYEYLCQVIIMVDNREGKEFARVLSLDGDIHSIMERHTQMDEYSHFTVYLNITDNMASRGQDILDALMEQPVGINIIESAKMMISEIQMVSFDEETERISYNAKDEVTFYIMDKLYRSLKNENFIDLTALQLLHNPDILMALDNSGRFRHELITVKPKANWTMLFGRIGFFDEMMRLINPASREFNLFTFNSRPYIVSGLDATGAVEMAKEIIKALKVNDMDPNYRRQLIRCSNYVTPETKEIIFNLVRLGIMQSQLNIDNKNHQEEIVFESVHDKEAALMAALNDEDPEICVDRKIKSLYSIFHKGMHRLANVEVPYLGCLAMLHHIKLHGMADLIKHCIVVLTTDKNTKFMLKKIKYEDGLKIYAGSFLQQNDDGGHDQIPFAILFNPPGVYTREQMGKLSNYTTQTFVPALPYLKILNMIINSNLDSETHNWKIGKTIISSGDDMKQVPAIYLDGNRVESGKIKLAERLQNYNKTYEQLFNGFIKKSGKASEEYGAGIPTRFIDHPMINPDTDGTGFLVIGNAELHDHHRWNQEFSIAKVIGGIVEAKKGTGEERVISAIKANLDLLTIDEAIALKLLTENDRSYINGGGTYIIANQNAIKKVIPVPTDKEAPYQEGYVAITKFMNSISYRTSASFGGVMNALSSELISIVEPNIQLSVLGKHKLVKGTLGIQYATGSDTIGPENKDCIVTLNSEKLREWLSPDGTFCEKCTLYRFPFDGNMAICDVRVDVSQKAPMKVTMYAMKIIGGDLDGDSPIAKGLPARLTNLKEEEIRLALGVFDPRIITETVAEQ